MDQITQYEEKYKYIKNEYKKLQEELQNNNQDVSGLF
jgi:translation elongation factor EF-1alpha